MRRHRVKAHLANLRRGLVIWAAVMIFGYGPFFIRNVLTVRSQIIADAESLAMPSLPRKLSIKQAELRKRTPEPTKQRIVSKEERERAENEQKLMAVFNRTDVRLLPPPYVPSPWGEPVMFNHLAVEITNHSDYDMGDHSVNCTVYSTKAAQGIAILGSTIDPINPPKIQHLPVLSGGRGETISCPLGVVLPGPISCVGVKVGLHFVIPSYAKRKDKWYNFQFIDGQWVQSNLENASDFCQQHP